MSILEKNLNPPRFSYPSPEIVSPPSPEMKPASKEPRDLFEPDSDEGGAIPPIAVTRGGPGEPSPYKPPLKWIEVAILPLAVLLVDWVVYQGGGYVAYAALFLFLPPLLWLGHFQGRRFERFQVGLFVAAASLAFRLVWEGSGMGIFLGFTLLLAFAANLSGLRPYVLEVNAFFGTAISSGFEALAFYARNSRILVRGRRLGGIAIWVPAAVLATFSFIFLQANPSLWASFTEFLRQVVDWISRFFPTPVRVVFWAAILWGLAGVLRPNLSRYFPKNLLALPDAEDLSGLKSTSLHAYPLARNTLGTAVALFAVYLVYEVQSLWFGEFPKGFYYSGYAHQGAAWLTVALAFSSLILSYIFRGPLLEHPKVEALKKLTWIWSAENLFLALCVFHRLSIYVDYNGMTRMRVVGYCGILAVTLGFLLSVWKVLRGKSFWWLVRMDLWALYGVVFLHTLAPVDSWVARYNVAAILSGTPSPAVQISVHPIEPSGIAQLLPLVECENATIREGVKAFLAETEANADGILPQGKAWEFRNHQLARAGLVETLTERTQDWAEYRDANRRQKALADFHGYAHQWYD